MRNFRETIKVTSVKGYLNIFTSTEHFEDIEYVYFKRFKGGIDIITALPSYEGKKSKANVHGRQYQFHYGDLSLIPIGDYKIDPDESEEDYIRIYFEDKI